MGNVAPRKAQIYNWDRICNMTLDVHKSILVSKQASIVQ